MAELTKDKMLELASEDASSLGGEKYMWANVGDTLLCPKHLWYGFEFEGEPTWNNLGYATKQGGDGNTFVMYLVQKKDLTGNYNKETQVFARDQAYRMGAFAATFGGTGTIFSSDKIPQVEVEDIE